MVVEEKVEAAVGAQGGPLTGNIELGYCTMQRLQDSGAICKATKQWTALVLQLGWMLPAALCPDVHC